MINSNQIHNNYITIPIDIFSNLISNNQSLTVSVNCVKSVDCFNPEYLECVDEFLYKLTLDILIPDYTLSDILETTL